MSGLRQLVGDLTASVSTIEFTPFVQVANDAIGVDRDELPALVVSNFRRLYPKLTVVNPDRWLGLVTQGGGVEPCVMLDGAFWKEKMQLMGGELIAAVPSVREVYFTPREPKQNIELLKHLAILHHEKAGKLAVSRTVFAWRNHRWEGSGSLLIGVLIDSSQS